MSRLITIENVIEFLGQEPQLDFENHKAYFKCPFCKKDYLDVFKKIFKKKYLNYIVNSNFEFGILSFDFVSRDFHCTSLHINPHNDVHAIALEMVIQEEFIPELTYEEYKIEKEKEKEIQNAKSN